MPAPMLRYGEQEIIIAEYFKLPDKCLKDVVAIGNKNVGDKRIY